VLDLTIPGHRGLPRQKLHSGGKELNITNNAFSSSDYAARRMLIPNYTGSPVTQGTNNHSNSRMNSGSAPLNSTEPHINTFSRPGTRHRTATRVAMDTMPRMDDQQLLPATAYRHYSSRSALFAPAKTTSLRSDTRGSSRRAAPAPCWV
jgi:hypothetical protein